MSILIKGMDMPKSCGSCVYNYNSCNCGITKSDIDRDYEYAERLSDCPLVEIPKHGDLIDRAALYKQMFSAGLSGKEDRNIAIDTMLQAPTVIEAEE